MRAIALASCLFALALGGCSGESGKTKPAVIADGNWRVVEVDGRKPAARTMWIQITNGAISGGFDGCNQWGFQLVNGKRDLVSDAAGCPPSPDLTSYQAVAQSPSNAAQPSMEGDVLVLKAGARSLRAQKLAAP